MILTIIIIIIIIISYIILFLAWDQTPQWGNKTKNGVK